jgi:hypothetical protein
MAEDTSTAPKADTSAPAGAEASPGEVAAAPILGERDSLPDDVAKGEVKGSEDKLFGAPIEAFVRFGTTSARHDKLMSERQAEEEQRRAVADEEKRLADQMGIHTGNPNEVAAQYESQFTNHPEVQPAYIPLQYMSRSGREVVMEGVGDIIMPQSPAFKNELALMIYCPRCRERLPAAHCIVTIRQSNRYWELDRRTAGDLFVFEGEPLRSAGMVMESEKFTCGRCSWSARIDKNRVWPA